MNRYSWLEGYLLSMPGAVTDWTGLSRTTCCGTFAACPMNWYSRS